LLLTVLVALMMDLETLEVTVLTMVQTLQVLPMRMLTPDHLVQ
jgi:hypothetical protein